MAEALGGRWRESRRRAGGDGQAPTRSAGRLAGAWYASSSARLGVTYAEWYHPAVDDLLRALLVAGGDVEGALDRVGAARARQGFTVSSLVVDLEALVESLPDGPRRRLLAVEPGRVLAEAWLRDEDVVPGDVGGRDDLALRLHAVHDDRRRLGEEPVETHALVVADLDLSGLTTEEAGVALHGLAQGLRAHFAAVGHIDFVAPARAAVIVRRHPGLAVTLASLRSELASGPGLEGAVAAVWLEDLPRDPAGAEGFVESVATCRPPRDVAREEALLETAPRATTPIPAGRRARTHRPQWQLGAEVVLSISAAVLTVVLVMVGGLATIGRDGSDAGIAAPTTAPRGPGVVAAPAPGPPLETPSDEVLVEESFAAPAFLPVASTEVVGGGGAASPSPEVAALEPAPSTGPGAPPGVGPGDGDDVEHGDRGHRGHGRGRGPKGGGHDGPDGGDDDGGGGHKRGGHRGDHDA